MEPTTEKNDQSQFKHELLRAVESYKFIKKRSSGMDKILDGLYIGSIGDSQDQEQITKHNVTHILSIHEDSKKYFDGIEYLCFKASDCDGQELKQLFQDAIDFIHKARLNNQNVLVHCLAGISRSVTIVIAYIMTLVEIPFNEALNVVRGARSRASPNIGFQDQLQIYEKTTIKTVREQLTNKYGIYNYDNDLKNCKILLGIYETLYLG